MTVFHPDHKHRFAIRKQIGYKHQLDSGVKLAMNFAARKTKLEVQVPKTDLITKIITMIPVHRLTCQVVNFIMMNLQMAMERVNQVDMIPDSGHPS